MLCYNMCYSGRQARQAVLDSTRQAGRCPEPVLHAAVLPPVLDRLRYAKSQYYMLCYNMCYSVTPSARQAGRYQEPVLHAVLQCVLQCYPQCWTGWEMPRTKCESRPSSCYSSWCCLHLPLRYVCHSLLSSLVFLSGVSLMSHSCHHSQEVTCWYHNLSLRCVTD